MDLFSKSPSRTRCPYSKGEEGVLFDSEISSNIAESLLDCYRVDSSGQDLHVCLRKDFRLFPNIPDQNTHRDIVGSLFGSDSQGSYQLKDEFNFCG